MEIHVSTELALLPETVDLVCAYVNDINPAVLTSDKPYCLPTGEVERMMETVCEGLDRNDPKIQFYFRSYTDVQYPGMGSPTSSVASILVYTGLRSNLSDLRQSRAFMHENPIDAGNSYRITSFYRGVGIAVCPEYRSLADELETIDMAEGLRLRLAIALTDYHRHVDEVCDLLEPYALRLKPLLESVMAKIEPRAQQWRDVLSTEKGQRAFLARINANTDTVQNLEIGMRIFYPGVSCGFCRVDEGRFYCSAGLELMPVKEKTRELSNTDIAAIQLLSSVDRLRVLKTLSGRTMTCSELAQELHMNRGTLFRDLNNLVQAGLVFMIAQGTSRTYTTRTEKLEQVVEHMMEFVNSGKK